MIGVLCGIQSEAQILERIDGLKVYCNLDGEAGLKADVNKLEAVLSWGTCGGIMPDMDNGTLIVSPFVTGANHVLWPCDNDWFHHLLRAADRLHDSHGINVMAAGTHSEQIVAGTASERSWLYRHTNRIAVEWESCFAAPLCREQRIPFAVVRAVSDQWDQELPSDVMSAIDKDGVTRLNPSMIAIYVARELKWQSWLPQGHRRIDMLGEFSRLENEIERLKAHRETSDNAISAVIDQLRVKFAKVQSDLRQSIDDIHSRMLVSENDIERRLNQVEAHDKEHAQRIIAIEAHPALSIPPIIKVKEKVKLQKDPSIIWIDANGDNWHWTGEFRDNLYAMRRYRDQLEAWYTVSGEAGLAYPPIVRRK